MSRQVIVCSIAKNEEQFVKRWHESSIDADYHYILDTGSTDKTVEVARDLGITVLEKTFDPWRFDVARNHLLQNLPEGDYIVINLDLDEVLVDGWRQALDTLHADVTRPRYKYVWSWKDNGTEGLVYQGDKIHNRHGYEWRHPVHEALYPLTEEIQFPLEGFEIHHHPDSTKSRGQYLPLLLLSVAEDPENDRNTYYCARELYFAGEFDTAIRLFKHHIEMPTAKWDAERAWSMRYLAKMLPEEREYWLKRAVETCEVRETLLDLAMFYYENGDWPNCFAYGRKCLLITAKPMVYLNEEDAWGETPYDITALAAHFLGNYKIALEYGEEACRINPNDERLKTNLYFYHKEYEKYLTIMEDGNNTHEGDK